MKNDFLGYMRNVAGDDDLDYQKLRVNPDSIYNIYESIVDEINKDAKGISKINVLLLLSSWLYGEAIASATSDKRNAIMSAFFTLTDKHESIVNKYQKGRNT